MQARGGAQQDPEQRGAETHEGCGTLGRQTGEGEGGGSLALTLGAGAAGREHCPLSEKTPWARVLPSLLLPSTVCPVCSRPGQVRGQPHTQEPCSRRRGSGSRLGLQGSREHIWPEFEPCPNLPAGATAAAGCWGRACWETPAGAASI